MFRFSAYAFSNHLQSVGQQPKCKVRARLGINLGPSPRHASSVALILNPYTGFVSPQFHIQFNNFFDTVMPSSRNPPTFSQWQLVSGIKAVKVKIFLPSEGDLIEPDPFISTREEANGDERCARADAETHQQDLTDQAHTSGDKNGP